MPERLKAVIRNKERSHTTLINVVLFVFSQFYFAFCELYEYSCNVGYSNKIIHFYLSSSFFLLVAYFVVLIMVSYSPISHTLLSPIFFRISIAYFTLVYDKKTNFFLWSEYFCNSLYQHNWEESKSYLKLYVIFS